MKKLAIVCSLALLSFASTAQLGYFNEALRFSQTNYSIGSTARMQGIGGAQVGLGGDISSAVANPAGLGFFNKSVFVFSPSINFNTNNTDYGQLTNDGLTSNGAIETFQNNFNFANIGAVINYGRDYADERFKGGSLAISLSRNSDFNLTRSYEGANDFNSLADALAEQAGDLLPGDLNGFQRDAYDSYLIDEQFDGNGFFTEYLAEFDGFPVQREIIEESGSHYQMNIAWGGNYDDVLYFGGGLGIQVINYSQRRSYEETDFAVFDQNGNSQPDDRLAGIFLDETIDTRGSGVNFNFGVITRPASFMTVGLSYTSPSFLSLDEEYSSEFEAVWKQGATYTLPNGDIVDLANEVGAFSNFSEATFQLRTPSRLALGTGIFIGKNGFITGDVEFVNYRNATINSLDFTIKEDNEEINRLYGSVVNIRAGGEYRIENFRLRAGYAFFPDPFEGSSLRDQTNISFGFGYRTYDYFLDFAVVNARGATEATPYTIFGSNQPVASTDLRRTTASITLGFNF